MGGNEIVPLVLSSASYREATEELLLKVISKIDEILLCDDKVDYGKRLYDKVAASCNPMTMRVCSVLGVVSTPFGVVFLSSYGRVPLDMSKRFLIGGIVLR